MFFSFNKCASMWVIRVRVLRKVDVAMEIKCKCWGRCVDNSCVVAKCEHLCRRNGYHIIDIKIFNIIILKMISINEFGFREV